MSTRAHVMKSTASSVRRLVTLLGIALILLSATLPLFAQPLLAQALPGQVLPGSNTSVLSQSGFLPVDEAFRFYTSLPEAGVVQVHWTIAPGYYLYREKFRFTLDGDQSPVSLETEMLAGTDHHDEYFGDVEVYYGQTEMTLRVPTSAVGKPQILVIEYQGCAEQGLCYTPQRREIPLIP